jgi:[glutamine synthetase] adenylyltransferase / [glutamine synthetase]-adenylyl-L-tyrosine phosphorylase
MNRRPSGGSERRSSARAAAPATVAVGANFLKAIEPFVWSRALDFGAIEEIASISQQIRDHYSKGQKFGPGFDLKRGRGGIREVEFYAHAQPARPRRPRAGAESASDPRCDRGARSAGYLDPALAVELGQAYRRLRTAEHRVQMVDDQQTHLLPPGEAALGNVAALHGLESGQELLDWLEPWVERVGSAFDELAGEDRSGLQANPGKLRASSKVGLPEPETAARRVSRMAFRAAAVASFAGCDRRPSRRCFQRF